MRATDPGSFLARAYAMGVEGAPPLAFKKVDLRENPDHPDHRFELVVERGTVVLCLGDEDSGVGDLGKFVLGLDRPISGDVLVFGTRVTDLRYDDLLMFRRRLGYTQVGDGLLQNLTLRGNIGLPLQYASDHRASSVVGRVEQLLDAFQLRDVAELRPAQANEEDRRRSAVARAVALDPDLLVLQAPFDGLTGRSAHELLDRARARTDGTPRTVFITAQDVTRSVGPLISRTVLLVDGEAVEGGRT